MVANFMKKYVTKSYVSLPGSGSDKAAGPSFCDLSRGSNLAASISVPQYVGMPICLTAEKVSKAVTSTANKRLRKDDSTESNKRLHMDGTNQNLARPSIEFITKPVSVTSGSVTVFSQERNSNSTPTINITNNEPVKANTDNTKATKLIIISNTNLNVTKLCDDNTQLGSENAILKKQVTMFKHLFRNPQRLESVQRNPINITNNEPVKANTNTKTTKILTISNTDHNLTKLCKENAQLKSENAILKKQVSMFMQIFRNPQRLESVVQRLNERAVIKPVPAA